MRCVLFEPYKWGTVTARYQELADGAWELAERVARECPEKAEAAHKMAERYARRMAENLNKANRIGTRCPSILIAGPAGVDSKKKERQCAAYMRNEPSITSCRNTLKNREASLMKNLCFVEGC